MDIQCTLTRMFSAAGIAEALALSGRHLGMMGVNRHYLIRANDKVGATHRAVELIAPLFETDRKVKQAAESHWYEVQPEFYPILT